MLSQTIFFLCNINARGSIKLRGDTVPLQKPYDIPAEEEDTGVKVVFSDG